LIVRLRDARGCNVITYSYNIDDASKWKVINIRPFSCYKNNRFPLESCKCDENMELAMLGPMGIHVFMEKNKNKRSLFD
jgi:hypothetical protein